VSVIAEQTHRSLNAGPRSIAARRLIGVASRLSLLVAATGCYSFIPTTTTALPELTPVSVSLTLGGTVAMKEALGDGVNEVDGTVVRSNSDSLVVAVEKMYTVSRQAFASSGTTTAIPRPYISVIKVRTFSRKRSVLMVVGSVAAAVAVALGAKAVASGDQGGGGVIQP
jgi:hypothetical protein